MTAANRDEAGRIADALVREKLAACVNVLGEISSVYEWKGTLEHATEVAMIAKTTREKYPELEKQVKQLHSYECPCMVAWPIAVGHAPFLDWIKASVQ